MTSSDQEEELENSFINDKSCRFYVIVGAKASGKTALLLSMIHYYLYLATIGKPRYAEFHLVLPSFETEQNDSYHFLLPHKDKVFVYPRYSPIVLEMMMRRKDAAVKRSEKTGEPHDFFFAIDDSSGFGQDMMSDHGLTQLITCCRHAQVSIVIVAHSLKSIVKPIVRQNVDWLVGFTTQNALVQFLWEEYIDGKFATQFPKWKDFQSAFYEHVWSQKHNAICLRLNPPPTELSWDVQNWRFIHFFLNKVLKQKTGVTWQVPRETCKRTSGTESGEIAPPKLISPKKTDRPPLLTDQAGAPLPAPSVPTTKSQGRGRRPKTAN